MRGPAVLNRPSVRVVKVGGSLFDLPDLPARVRAWLADEPPSHCVLIAGGGMLVEQVRQWHAQSPLDEVAAHWVCVDLMRVTARLLQAWLPEFQVTGQYNELRERLGQSGTTIFCVAEWLRRTEPSLSGIRLPSHWDVTSDAIAGRLAATLGADELVLLKSELPKSDEDDLPSLAAAGFIDQMLPRLAQELPPLRLVNLRSQPWSVCKCYAT